MNVTSFDQINNTNTIIVLYPSGASGEFLAGTIAKSFDLVHSSSLNDYVTHNRYTYFDLFDRELSSSADPLNENQILDGINNYFSTNNDVNKAHIGLSHPTKHCVEFIEKHLNNARIVEITTVHTLSKKFRVVAAENKIPKHEHFTAHERYNFQMGAMKYDQSLCEVVHKLTIEWVELFAGNPENIIQPLEKFLMSQCDREMFVSLVQEYIQKNKPILDQSGAIPSPT